MPQVKKEDVRTAILEATLAIVSDKGYVGASMSQIARTAGVSNANIYIYFQSKVDVFFSVYEVWLKEKIGLLEEKIDLAGTPEEKCRVFLNGLLREIPTLDNCFTNNLIQAISTVGPSEHYKPELREWLESRIEAILKSVVPQLQKAHAKRRRLAHFIVMTFDGCAVNYRVNHASLLDEKLVQDFTDMLLQ